MTAKRGARKSATKTEVDAASAMAEKAKVMTGVVEDAISLKDGTEVEIYKCKAKNIGRVMDFIAFIMTEMKIDSFGDMPTEIDLKDPNLILPLLTKAAARIIYLSADLCSLSKEEVEELELDDMIKLVTAQFEVNKDFFLKNVLPSVPLGQAG